MVIIASVQAGAAIAAGMLAILVALGLTVATSRVVDKRPWWTILNPKRQSWAYMFGDPLCLAPAFAFAAVAWGKGLVPTFVYSWWWLPLGYFVGLVLADVLCALDRVRYSRYGATAALRHPSKRVHDQVAMPAIAGALVVTTAPLLFVWSIWTTLVLLFAAAWFVLVVVDDRLRQVDPCWQYNLV